MADFQIFNFVFFWVPFSPPTVCIFLAFSRFICINSGNGPSFGPKSFCFILIIGILFWMLPVLEMNFGISPSLSPAVFLKARFRQIGLWLGIPNFWCSLFSFAAQIFIGKSLVYSCWFLLCLQVCFLTIEKVGTKYPKEQPHYFQF